MNDQESQDYQDYLEEIDGQQEEDMEPLTDEIANAIEELANEAEDEDGDKIIVDLVKTYENADTMKNVIFRDNN